MTTAYVKLPAEVSEQDAYTVFKSMRHTLKADKVTMETAEPKTDSDPPRVLVTGYFWAEQALPSLDTEEVADGQGSS